MPERIEVSAKPGFYITEKPGRTISRTARWNKREDAERYLRLFLDPNTMHVIEVPKPEVKHGA